MLTPTSLKETLCIWTTNAGGAPRSTRKEPSARVFFEGFWYCNSCWEVWLEARERILKADDHRREIRQRQKVAGREQGPNSDEEDSDTESADRSGKGLGRGAVAILPREVQFSTASRVAGSKGGEGAAETSSRPAQEEPQQPNNNDENKDCSNIGVSAGEDPIIIKKKKKNLLCTGIDLQELSLFQLLTLVKGTEINADKVEAAMDGDDPKAALRALLTT